MPLPIERKIYTQDCSPQDIKVLKSQVYLHSDNVIYWKEAPVMSCWQVDVYSSKVDELIQELESFCILIDLTDTKPPNAKIRASLRNMFIPLNDRGLIKAVAFTEKNFLINVAAKFVLGGSGLDFSVHTTQAQAEAEIQSLSKPNTTKNEAGKK